MRHPINKTLTIVLAFAAGMIIPASLTAQDSVLNRNVTVERDFQPVIQSAGKISLRPQAVQTAAPEPVKMEFSDYTTLLMPDYNLNPLLSQVTKFKSGSPYKGTLRAGGGYPQTLFYFDYRHSDKKRNWLDISIRHDANWGLKTLEQTSVAFDFRHRYSGGQVYINLLGANEFYTRYGRYYNDTAQALMTTAMVPVKGFGDLQATADYTHVGDRQNVWKFATTIGVESDTKDDLRYAIEAGYRLLSMTDLFTEHQVRAKADIAYVFGDHKVGGIVREQSHFFVADTARVDPSTYNSHHGLRIEPFYEYLSERVRLHLGVNLDVNFGKGQMLSGSPDIAFAPSPNILFEAQLAPKWAVFYLNATGSLGFSATDDYLQANRYADMIKSIQSKHMSMYTPINAELGFRFRAHRDLLLSVHAAYTYRKNNVSFAAAMQPTSDPQPYAWDGFKIAYSNFQQWKMGATVAYHYRDIVDLHLWGDYYTSMGVQNETTLATTCGMGITQGRLYDLPDWEIGFRIDGHINRNWMVYTYNRFAGGGWAMTNIVNNYDLATGAVTVMDPTVAYDLTNPAPSDRKLPTLIDVNLGVQYNYNDALAFFAELKNIAHQRNTIHYGYDQQGINFLLGVNWRF